MRRDKRAYPELGASQTLLIELDLRDNKSILNAVDKVVQTFGKIDILINNAGVAVWKPLKKQNLADIEDQIRTNLERPCHSSLTRTVFTKGISYQRTDPFD